MTGNDFADAIILIVLGGIVAIFVHDPIRRWWDKRTKSREYARRPIKFRVIYLLSPDRPGFDWNSELIVRQEARRMVFEVERLAVPAPAEVSELESIAEEPGLESLKDFTEKVGAAIARARRGRWTGDANRQRPTKRFKEPRDLVLTNIPLPGNLYGWNTKDRSLLIISTASVLQFFGKGATPTLDDFGLRMAQRMAIFSVSPGLDPRRTHSETVTTCLFDFTMRLQDVVNVVQTGYVCPDCYRCIRNSHGDGFADSVRRWVEFGKKQVSE